LLHFGEFQGLRKKGDLNMIGVVDFLGREFRVRMILGCSMAHGGMVGRVGVKQWMVIFLDKEWFRSQNAPG